MDGFQVIDQSLGKNAVIIIYDTDVDSGILVKLGFTFSGSKLHDHGDGKENGKI